MGMKKCKWWMFQEIDWKTLKQKHWTLEFSFCLLNKRSTLRSNEIKELQKKYFSFKPNEYQMWNAKKSKSEQSEFTSGDISDIENLESWIKDPWIYYIHIKDKKKDYTLNSK